MGLVVRIGGGAVIALLAVWFAIVVRERWRDSGKVTDAPRSLASAAAKPSRWWPEAAVALAAFSAGAGIIHLAVVREHWSEHVLSGWFFIVAGIAQIVWAVLMLRRPSPAAALAGLLGNLVFVVLWVASRTTGLPLGPDAGAAEPVGVVDVVATLFEVGIVAGCAGLLRRRSLIAAPRLLTRTLRAPAFASVVAVVTFGALIGAQ